MNVAYLRNHGPEDVVDPGSGCIDLVVDVNPSNQTMSVAFEGNDLLRYTSTGETSWRVVETTLPPRPLGADLGASLVAVAELLDPFCRDLVVLRPS